MTTTLNTITSILQILGALGVFLFGMKIRSEGMQRLAGARMRKALASVTKNRVSGVLTGLFTTSLIQSSSATTVLVVSLVNAGLLTLVGSIGVIMGANLGTTLTAWIVAATGTKFSLSAIALPIVGVGFPMFFIGKLRAKAIGEFLVGFGLLFLGLSLLKDVVPDLKELVKTDPDTASAIQSWIEFFSGKGYFSYILFMIGGIILTLMVQSSSAAMAITITCAMAGWFGTEPYKIFQISAAVVLGENIGTTITAWLAALGANRNAKRAARAHFLFNVIGVVWMLIAFKGFTYLVWEATDYLPDSLREANDDYKYKVAFATAIFHTTFNLLNISLLIWFVPQIARIVKKWVPDTGDEGERPRLRYISQNLVDLGELNLVEAENAIRLMSNNCDKMFKGFMDVFEHPKEDMSQDVIALKKMEEDADQMMHEITEYLVQCSTREVGDAQASNIASMIRIVAELEECTDRIYRLVKLVERKYNKNREFSEEQIGRVKEMADVVGQSISVSDNHLLRPISSEVLRSAHTLEEQSDTMRKRFNKEAMRRMAGGDIRVEMIYTDINNHLEAIANHALNVIQESSAIKLDSK